MSSLLQEQDLRMSSSPRNMIWEWVGYCMTKIWEWVAYRMNKISELVATRSENEKFKYCRNKIWEWVAHRRNKFWKWVAYRRDRSAACLLICSPQLRPYSRSRPPILATPTTPSIHHSLRLLIPLAPSLTSLPSSKPPQTPFPTPYMAPSAISLTPIRHLP